MNNNNKNREFTILLYAAMCWRAVRRHRFYLKQFSWFWIVGVNRRKVKTSGKTKLWVILSIETEVETDCEWWAEAEKYWQGFREYRLNLEAAYNN